MVNLSEILHQTALSAGSNPSIKYVLLPSLEVWILWKNLDIDVIIYMSTMSLIKFINRLPLGPTLLISFYFKSILFYIIMFYVVLDGMVTQVT